jgi:hypothetical protein
MAYKKTSLTEKLGLSTRLVASYDLTKISAPATDRPTQEEEKKKSEVGGVSTLSIQTHTQRERESRAKRFATFF